jgi:hypothetical protein
MTGAGFDFWSDCEDNQKLLKTSDTSGKAHAI